MTLGVRIGLLLCYRAPPRHPSRCTPRHEDLSLGTWLVSGRLRLRHERGSRLATERHLRCRTACLCHREAGFSERPRRYRLRSAVAPGLVTLAAWGTLHFPLRSALGVQSVRPEQAVYIYDVAATPEENGAPLFPRSIRPASLTQLDGHFLPGSANAMMFGSTVPLPYRLRSAQVTVLETSWRRALFNDPILYTYTRLDLWARLNGLFTRPKWVTHPEIDPNDQGLTIEHELANIMMLDYSVIVADARNRDSMLYRPIPWILAAALLWAIVAHRRKTLRTATLVVLAATSGYEAGLFVAAPVNEHRLAFPVVMVAVALVVVNATATWQARKGVASIRSAFGNRSNFDRASTARAD
ncbi:hypothetical protein HRbin41_00301 [bacterium HR41]|nr:hypothetical protein HRbin41_00301 [bacterium HR41]